MAAPWGLPASPLADSEAHAFPPCIIVLYPFEQGVCQCGRPFPTRRSVRSACHFSREVDRALATLTERERDIIKLFFGIACQEMTLEEIGEKFGLTRERVRQIKEKAIRRLRHTSRSKLLKTYLG